jgi:cytochrome c oxidase cbb3-type subunit III
VPMAGSTRSADEKALDSAERRVPFPAMSFRSSSLRRNVFWDVFWAAALWIGVAIAAAQNQNNAGQVQQPAQNQAQQPSVQKQENLPATHAPSSALVDSGRSLFQQNCAFCHGRDAAGGESGPDLTRSKLVSSDSGGDKIGPVVRQGRPDKGMPHFDFSDDQIASIVAFLHHQQSQASSKLGGRRGVDVSDLQTGNVEQGKKYFNGDGGCSSCHSPTGDLAGIASRYQGLALEERMLYPKDAKSKVTVTLPSGKTVSGVLEYHDEFTIGLRDADGTYQSWPADRVKYSIDAPVNAHVELFSKYTDADIHNLMAYLQTLR